MIFELAPAECDGNKPLDSSTAPTSVVPLLSPSYEFSQSLLEAQGKTIVIGWPPGLRGDRASVGDKKRREGRSSSRPVAGDHELL
jgi:hypothetical protein